MNRIRGSAWSAGLIGFLAVAILLLGIFVDGDSGGVSVAGASGILNYGEDLQSDTGAGAISLDPARAGDNPLERPFMQLIYDNLVRQGPGGTAVPGLATSWSFPNSEAIILHLRSGVRFQDGTPFDAEAVSAGLHRNLMSSATTFNPIFHDLRAVVVNGPLQLTLELSTPVSGQFFALLWGPETYIVSPSAARSEGSAFFLRPVGAGPYRLTKFIPNQEISLRKFLGYWQTTGWRLRGVNFTNVDQGQPQVTSFLAHQVDMFQPNTNDERDAVSGHPGVTVAHSSALGNYYVGLCTTGSTPLASLDVRKAIAHAVNRRLIASVAAGGVGVVSNQPWPISSPFYDAASKPGPKAYDPALAQSLLRRAGYPRGFSITFETVNFSELTTIGLALQQELGNVGIRVTLDASDNFVQDQLIDKKAPADISADIEPGAGLVSFMDPASIANFCGFHDRSVEAALKLIRSTPPGSAGRSNQGLSIAWHTIDHELTSRLPGIVLFLNGVMLAYNNQVVGGVTQLYDQSAGPNFQTLYMK